MTKYFLAFILLASPCFAGMGVGGFPYPGPGVLISGASEWAIEDDFSSNTLSNYTEFIDGSGALVRSTTYANLYNSGAGGTFTWNYHSTDLGSSSQTVQAVICERGGSTTAGGSGLVLRANGTSGHGCWPDIDNNRFTCNEFPTSSGTPFNKSWTAGAWATDACHLTQISVGSDNIYKFEVDFNDDGDFEDTNEQVGNSSANTSYSGTKVGVGFKGSAGESGTINYLDNFKARVYYP